MPRFKKTEKDIGNATFIGSTFSNAELEFLLEHFGEAPEVAVSEDRELPVGVNPAALLPILDRTYRLQLMQEAAQKQNPDAVLWVGFDALRKVCQDTLDWNATVAELKRRTANQDPAIRRMAGAPSLHMWDPDTDVGYLGGVGADAGTVMTAINDDGSRTPLFAMLRATGVGSIGDAKGVATFLRKGKKGTAKRLEDTPNALIYESGPTTSVITCPICQHSEVYETGKASTKKDAETLMRRHLKTVRVKVDPHRMLAKRLDSGRAGTGSAKKAVETTEDDEA